MAQLKIVSPTAILLGVVLAGFLFGSRIMNTLYAAGMLGKPPSPAEASQELNRLVRRSNLYTCEKGTDGWDFICEYTVGSGTRMEHRQIGIISSWMDPIKYKVPFEPGKPIPSRAEWGKKWGF